MTTNPLQKAPDVVAQTMERITRARGSIHPDEAQQLEQLVSAFWRDELRSELELRVGRRMTEGLASAELDEFDTLSLDADAAMRWIETFVPHYPQIVSEETARLVAEAAYAFAGVRAEAERVVDVHV